MSFPDVCRTAFVYLSFPELISARSDDAAPTERAYRQCFRIVGSLDPAARSCAAISAPIIMDRATNLGVVWRDGKPDCGVDLAPDHRGFPMGPRVAIPHSGSGHLVRASVRAASARHGHSRSADCVPITLAKCICREAHRLDPPGMPGPHDRIRSSAPALDSRCICRLL
jgi:hypothetical protein